MFHIFESKLGIWKYSVEAQSPLGGNLLRYSVKYFTYFKVKYIGNFTLVCTADDRELWQTLITTGSIITPLQPMT